MSKGNKKDVRAAVKYLKDGIVDYHTESLHVRITNYTKCTC